MFLLYKILFAILMSCIGNSVYKWFAKTKMGIWFDAQVSRLLSHVTGKVDHLALMDDNENNRSSK